MKTVYKLILITVLLAVALLICACTASEPEAFDTAIGIVEGKEYLIACTNQLINDKENQKFTQCVLKSIQSADDHGLAYCQRESEPYAKDTLWLFEDAGNGRYYMKSASDGKYLNMKPAGDGDSDGHGYAVMESAKQALNVSRSNNFWKISANLNGTTYYIRFTNLHEVSCWEAGTSDDSNSFTLLCAGGADASMPKADPEYKNNTEPLFKIVAFSDPHVDYGIQSWDTPIRESSVTAAQFVKDTLGGADIAIVAGDLTSNNGGNIWTKELFDKVQSTMVSTFAGATHTGKVLFVAGNHDNEAGINADNSWYSGDWSAAMEQKNGAFAAELHFNDMSFGESAYNEQVCYRYSYNGMEFIGISPPYRPQRDGGIIYLKQIEWVERQLQSIGSDKTVIIICHYPVDEIPDASEDPGAQVKMQAVLNAYPNTIYAYGHVHGGDDKYAWVNTSELVVPSDTATLLDNNAYEVDSYINAHCGSMAYYMNMFDEYDWLGAEEPGVNQLLMMEFYSDHITFRYYNTGEKTAIDGVREIASFTVVRDMLAQLGENSGTSDVKDGGMPG